MVTVPNIVGMDITTNAPQQAVQAAGLVCGSRSMTHTGSTNYKITAQVPAATGKPIGVLQAPVGATGDPVDVVVVGETQLQADAALAFGYGIGTSSDGQAANYEIGRSATNYVAGMVVNVAGGTTAGNLIT